MAGLIGELGNGKAITSGLVDECKFVHREDPCPSGGGVSYPSQLRSRATVLSF